MHRGLLRLVAVPVLTFAMALPAAAGITVYEKDNKKIEIGGRLQWQYRHTDPDGGESFDETFFRRLRPYIAGTVTENWMGKIEFEFGESSDDDEVKIKDAYMQYRGVKNLKVTLGNSKTPFSREFLTSSKRQQLVERTFTGDHNFGAPDRQLGVRVDGQAMEKKVTWFANAGFESHDPDVNRMDFDTPVNNKSDWNEGVQIAGRVEFHPLGYVKFDQADFHSDELKFTVAVAVFTWSNDDDNNTYTDPLTGLSTSTSRADLDSANGFELSGSVRGLGFSADVDYQMLSGDTVDPMFTGGLYANGTTDLDKLAVEGGYMLPGDRVEVVGAWDSLSADNYAEDVERTSFGVNWYWDKHNAKWQFTYQQWDNVLGVAGVGQDIFYSQVQFTF